MSQASQGLEAFDCVAVFVTSVVLLIMMKDTGPVTRSYSDVSVIKGLHIRNRLH